MTKQRKKTQSITDTIAQHLETETIAVEEKNEEVKTEVEEVTPISGETFTEKEEKEIVTFEEKPKEKIIVSPHHKDSDTSAINFGLNSIF